MTQESCPVAAHVVFRKQVSDGNFGSEIAEVSLDLEEDTFSDDDVAALLATARRMVHAELAQSPSPGVRRAVEYPRPAPVAATVGADDDEGSEDLPY